MTTAIHNLFLEDVIKNLRAIAECESILYQNSLIKSDMEIDIKSLKEAMDAELTEYYFAIREMGSESHFRKECLDEICRKRNQMPHIHMKVCRCDRKSEIFSMIVERDWHQPGEVR